MRIEVVQLPVTDVDIVRKGAKGDDAFDVWKQNGHPNGTIAEFFSQNTKVFQYVDKMDETFTHTLGKVVQVQCFETLTGVEYEPSVERLDLDRVRIQTLIYKNLTIIVI